MSSETAVHVEGVGKFYRRPPANRSEVTQGASRRWRGLRRPPQDGFWALDDVNIDVGAGEIVGIVGRNGAGKSTLLKILSRITHPSVGQITLRGSVASLLEVGSGFHPELTGRENIYLNGSILGMRRAEIRNQLDEIVEFAGVADFLEMPVKRYSSGMYVRLAFAIAAHLTPRILIIDEVLAVGDAEFQRKCLGRMDAVAHGEGRTVLFVSHNFAAVSALCDRVVLLDKGRVTADGKTSEVLEAYTTSLAADGYQRGDEFGVYDVSDRVENMHGGPQVLRAVQLRNEAEEPIDSIAVGAPLVVDVHVDDFDRLRDGAIGLSIESEYDMRLLAISTRIKPAAGRGARAEGDSVVRFRIAPLPLPPGRYHIGLAVQDGDERWVESVPKGAPLTVVDNDFYGSGWKLQVMPGTMAIDFTWEQMTAPGGR